MHAAQAVGVQVGLNHVGDGRDRRDPGDRRRAPVSGKVHGEHVEIGREAGRERREVIAGGTDAVEKQQRLAGPGAIKSKRWRHAAIITHSLDI